MTKTMTHVEELRHVASLDQCAWGYAQKLMRSSADEIERLDADAAGVQAELASVKLERHQLRNELTAAGLENERLKRELEVQKGVVDFAYIPHRHLVEQRDRADSEFKNFHRLLCERFGYGHDERGWRRDQLSLIEHIANRTAPEPGACACPDGVRRWVNGINCEACGLPSKSVSAHLPNQAQWCQDPDCPQCASQRTNLQQSEKT